MEDEYTSFCFDEACMYISRKLEDGKKATWIEDKIDSKTGKKKTFQSEALKKKGVVSNAKSR